MAGPANLSAGSANFGGACRLALGPFVKARDPSFAGLAAESPLAPASDEEYQTSLPIHLGAAWRDGMEATQFEPRPGRQSLGVVAGISPSVQAAGEVDEPDSAPTSQYFGPSALGQQVRQSAVVRFWDEGDDVMKDMLMEKLSFWADI